LYFIIVVSVGVVSGIRQFFKDAKSGNLPVPRYHDTEPDNGKEEKTAFYNQQLLDYKKLYDLAMLELQQADTVTKQRSCQQRLISLDSKIFQIQQKIYKLQG
jgi:hypothetical protein